MPTPPPPPEDPLDFLQDEQLTAAKRREYKVRPPGDAPARTGATGHRAAQMAAGIPQSDAKPKHCRNCGNQVDAQAIACLSCGRAPSNGNKFCQNCGADTDPEAIICVKCGVSTARVVMATAVGVGGPRDGKVHPSDPPKDPVLMCVLSVLLVGLGQMILGQTAKGAVMLCTALFFGIPLALFTYGLAIPAVWFMSGADAYRIGQKLKQGRSVGEWEFF